MNQSATAVTPAPAHENPLWEAMQHVPELVQAKHVRIGLQGGGALGRFNSAIAVKITGAVGTMWAAYLFTILALVALPAAIATGQALVIVAWIAQTFLQLVLLPIIIVGQNVISEAQDKRAEADHKTLVALHRMNIQQLKILEDQEKILAILEKNTVGAS